MGITLAESWNNIGTTLALTTTTGTSNGPATVGDLMVVGLEAYATSALVNPTAVSGGGVTTWNLAPSTGTTWDSGTYGWTEWYGIVTTAGGSPTLSQSGGNGSQFYWACGEWTGGVGTWARTTSSSNNSTTTAESTWTGPSLTATAGELGVYFFLFAGVNCAAGSTPGYVYSTLGTSAAAAFCVYNLNLGTGATAPVTPTALGSGPAGACGALFSFTTTITYPPLHPLIVRQSVNRASTY